MEFVFFLGRFHVLALHLPIALLLAAALVDWLSRRPRRRHLGAAVPFLWGAGAVSALVTVVLGYMHFAEGGFVGPSATAHRWLGTSVAVVSVAAWVLSMRWRPLYMRTRAPLSLLAVALLIVTGHYGGNLTHGSTYLLEYAPETIRAAAGLKARRPPVTDLLAADPYLDLVQPILEARCAGCHNEDKRNGELSLASIDGLFAGGETGPVVGAAGRAKSELYRRITLPEGHDDFMPAEGKTPLTGNQVAIVGWWIDAGFPRDMTFAAIELDETLRDRFRVELGLAADGSGLAPESTAPAITGPPPALLQSLVGAGFSVRAVSQSDSRLVVQAHIDAGVSTVQLDALTAVSAFVRELSLPRSGLQDQDLGHLVRGLEELTHLRVDNNQLTDNGVGSLGALKELQYLNLYGNPAITDASIDTLAELPRLEQLYVWGTGISQPGITRLRALRPDLEVNSGARALGSAN